MEGGTAMTAQLGGPVRIMESSHLYVDTLLDADLLERQGAAGYCSLSPSNMQGHHVNVWIGNMLEVVSQGQLQVLDIKGSHSLIYCCFERGVLVQMKCSAI